MCAMKSGLFIGSNDGRPPNPYKENLVSLNDIIVNDYEKKEADGIVNSMLAIGPDKTNIMKRKPLRHRRRD